jgi:hypothetical protein
MDKEVEAAERAEEKYRREMQQQDEDQARADAAQARREARSGFETEINEAVREREYFETLLANNEARLAFFDLYASTLEDTPQAWEQMDRISEGIERIYDESATYHAQLDNLDGHISDMNFELFIQEQGW